MGIEIRQLVVKSEVLDGSRNKDMDARAGAVSGCELDSIREDLLEECKDWFQERQLESGER
jgi:hypothetical protein